MTINRAFFKKPSRRTRFRGWQPEALEARCLLTTMISPDELLINAPAVVESHPEFVRHSVSVIPRPAVIQPPDQVDMSFPADMGRGDWQAHQIEPGIESGMLSTIDDGIGQRPGTRIIPIIDTDIVEPGDTFRMHIEYENGDTSGTTGLALRIHFDSSQMTLAKEDIEGIYGIALSAIDVQDDQVLNSDGDPTTDTFVNLLWADMTGQWLSGQETTRLITLPFVATEQFDSTTVRLTGDVGANKHAETFDLEINAGEVQMVETDLSGPDLSNTTTDKKEPVEVSDSPQSGPVGRIAAVVDAEVVKPGDTFRTHFEYDLRETAGTIGLNLKIHFDSSQLELDKQSFEGLFNFGLSAKDIQDDLDDLDNDPSTDKHVNLLWVSMGGHWLSGQESATRLVTLPFVATELFNSTTVRITGSVASGKDAEVFNAVFVAGEVQAVEPELLSLIGENAKRDSPVNDPPANDPQGQEKTLPTQLPAERNEPVSGSVATGKFAHSNHDFAFSNLNFAFLSLVDEVSGHRVIESFGSERSATNETLLRELVFTPKETDDDGIPTEEHSDLLRTNEAASELDEFHQQAPNDFDWHGLLASSGSYTA